MLIVYLKAAMRRAKYELLTDDGSFYGEIPGCEGMYSTAATLEACRDELEEVLVEMDDEIDHSFVRVDSPTQRR